MGSNPYLDLSRRERQIMDALYRRGRASVGEVLEDMPDPPSYSAVRAMLGKLEEKGHVDHEQDGPRYVYFPRQPREEATETALQRVVGTFFDGSRSKAVAAMLDLPGARLSDEELAELARMIEDARGRGR